MKLKIKLLNENAQLPEKKTDGAACFDLYTSESFTLEPMVGSLLPTGLAFEIPEGYCMKIYLRSSMCKRGIIASTGIVDNDFRKEVKVQALNITQSPIVINKGERVGQAMIVPLVPTEIEQVMFLSETNRTGGFGSTGL